MSEIDLQGLSWHQGKHIIAFISGANQVSIRDYEDKGLFFFNSIYMFMLPVHMLWMHAVLIISFCADEKEPCLLTSDSQRSVKALEWRPNGGKSISVACRWVLIWPPLNTIYFLLLGSFLYDQVTPASIETGEGYAYGLLPILVTWLWLELVVLH